VYTTIVTEIHIHVMMTSTICLPSDFYTIVILQMEYMDIWRYHASTT